MIGKTPRTMKPNSQGLMKNRPQRRLRRWSFVSLNRPVRVRWMSAAATAMASPRYTCLVSAPRGPGAGPRDIVMRWLAADGVELWLDRALDLLEGIHRLLRV